MSVRRSPKKRNFNPVRSAVRQANLASKGGSKVTVKVQQGSGALKTEYVARPLRE